MFWQEVGSSLAGKASPYGIISGLFCFTSNVGVIATRRRTVVKTFLSMCNGDHVRTSCKSMSYECTHCKPALDVVKIPNIEFNHTIFDKNYKSFVRAIKLSKS